MATRIERGRFLIFSTAVFGYQRRRRRCALSLVATLSCWGVLGCAPKGISHPKTIPVKGKVTYQGKPLTQGTVNFLPEDSWPAIGEIQPNGEYTLSTFEKGDGAVLGFHRVVIFSTDANPRLMPGSPHYKTPKELIPKKYTTAESSGLEAIVEPGTKAIDFELK